MAVKIFKACCFFSLLGALATLLFVYASLPEQVVVREEGAKLISLHRDTFFYSVVAVMTLVNVLVYIVAKLFAKNLAFRSWFYGMVAILNVFFVVALKLISTFNSGEKFRYEEIDFIIYGSVILIIIWAITWPVYVLYQKISTKQSV